MVDRRSWSVMACLRLGGGGTGLAGGDVTERRPGIKVENGCEDLELT